MVIDPSKDMVTALGLGGVVLELSVGHSVQRPGCVRPAAIALAGIYEDVIVRTPQGWRFQSRVVHAATSGPLVRFPNWHRHGETWFLIE